MDEINPVQNNQPIRPIRNNELIHSFDSSNKSIEVQLQYDEAEKTILIEQLKKAVNTANEQILGVNTQFQYRIHEGTDRIMVKLIDTESHDVIREIPPEKMLDLVADIWKRVGLVIDKQH